MLTPSNCSNHHLSRTFGGPFVAMFLLASLTLADPPPSSEPSLRSGERWVHQYKNGDGQVPDGENDSEDDTAAFLQALQDGPGVVRVPRGTFYCSEITVPSGVTLMGEGPATILRGPNNKPIVSQKSLDNWQIRDLSFAGNAGGDWHSRQDEKQAAISVFDCRAFSISDVTAVDFNGAAIQLEKTMLTLDDRYPTSRSHLHRITVERSFIGIRFDTRAEYINATHLSCSFNVVGCAIHAGNVQIAASGFNNNVDGMVIEDKQNGSHGCITGCILNHNDRFALHCKNVTNGMAIDGCAFFYGAIKIEKCVGVNLTSGMISCTVDAKDNTLANRVSGNFVIENPPGYTFEFSPQILVEGNFDAKGSWQHNRAVSAPATNATP
ncbi:MAG: hypothetical protein O2931_12480 [Planctomycetota bacterium]|nr:hypothetical protein [Planctomycetota bacterium]MDA1179602.1 hypothetical protein [Planctomycetota bacterium]